MTLVTGRITPAIFDGFQNQDIVTALGPIQIGPRARYSLDCLAAPIHAGWTGRLETSVRNGFRRSLYLALGFWLARKLFHRETLTVDCMTRLRNAGF